MKNDQTFSKKTPPKLTMVILSKCDVFLVRKSLHAVLDWELGPCYLLPLMEFRTVLSAIIYNHKFLVHLSTCLTLLWHVLSTLFLFYIFVSIPPIKYVASYSFYIWSFISTTLIKYKQGNLEFYQFGVHKYDAWWTEWTKFSLIQNQAYVF